MARQTNAAPVIIRRRKVSAEHGHHGGAWKVAYADFVTAMMAFFLLMWLLNATTEKQRKGIADYFNPTIPIARVSGGGNGVFGGDSVFSEDTLVRTGTGAQTPAADDRAETTTHQALEDLRSAIQALSGESLEMERLMRHVVTRITDEGLVVEMFDLPESPLFDQETAQARPVLRDLVQVVTGVFSMARNQVAVQGYVQSYPITLIADPSWDLSVARAETVRKMAVSEGLDGSRLQRIAGFADRAPLVANPMAPRNNRIEVVLLRQMR